MVENASGLLFGSRRRRGRHTGQRYFRVHTCGVPSQANRFLANYAHAAFLYISYVNFQREFDSGRCRRVSPFRRVRSPVSTRKRFAREIVYSTGRTRLFITRRRLCLIGEIRTCVCVCSTCEHVRVASVIRFFFFFVTARRTSRSTKPLERR